MKESVRIIYLWGGIVVFTALLLILWEFWLEPMLVNGHESTSEKWQFISVGIAAVMVALILPLMNLIKSDRKLKISLDELEATRDSLREAQRIAHVGHWEWKIGEDKNLWSEECSNILTGLPDNRVVTYTTFLNVIHPDDRASVQASVARSIDKLSAGTNEYRVCRPDGTVRTVISRWDVHVNLATGEPLAVIGTVQDITQRKQIEQLLADSMSELEVKELAKSRFLAAAGHDLRQPLAAANLFIGALKYTEPSPKQKDIIQHLDQVMSNFNDLLDVLLNISKLDEGIIKPEISLINVPKFFNWMDKSFSPIAQQKLLKFRLFYPTKKTLLFYSDIKLLKIIMSNLISNAIKFTSEGGVLISARSRGDQLLFQVWDCGIGINDENINKVFDDFFQISNPQRDKAKGMGLGLSIVKRALPLIDGTITCRSKVGDGSGSVFELSLPLATSPDGLQYPDDVATSQINIDYAGFMKSKRIAVVEDDPMISKALGNSLLAMGGMVKCFSTAEAATAYANIHDFDYYIVDYMLGGKINGIQFLDQLQQERIAPVNAVLLTGDTSPNVIKAVENSEWSILFKPTSLSSIIDQLSRQVI